MVISYLGLGSNIGERSVLLGQAIALIGQKIGPVVRFSDIVESEPYGFVSNNMFLNMVVAVETELAPEALLDATQEIERMLGRVEKTVDGKYSDRTIDIDILLYGDTEYSSSRLTIPHPHIRERRFVLEPLKQINPEYGRQLS
ncbi:MAG: 2-amino-4-hydroxy-6-hydroxymethyldihydropteridine diphosphokinase [Bacteroidaceae bacterium]|nr:2-amino-4-hydroxy-6-hydroxymethyldihydropteridine diphosphokinase [Bacteroidaceae bacterium]